MTEARNDPTADVPNISGNPESSGGVATAVPKGLRVGAALSWRFIVVIAALYVLIRVVGYLAVVFVPLSVALLLAALLIPAVHRLVRAKVPRGLATGIVLIGGLGLLGGLLTFVIVQFTDGLPALQRQLNNSLNQIKDWLINGPLHLRQEQLQEFINSAIGFLQRNQAEITNSALSTASAVGETLTGFLLTLFVLIFFLAGGEQIWTFLTRAVPTQVRARADVAGRDRKSVV